MDIFRTKLGALPSGFDFFPAECRGFLQLLNVHLKTRMYDKRRHFNGQGEVITMHIFKERLLYNFHVI